MLFAFAVAVAIVPAQAQATELMVEHFASPRDPVQRSRAYEAAGVMGAKFARLIVEGGISPNTFDWNRQWAGTERVESVRDFVLDAVAHEMSPYLTLSASGVPSTTDYAYYCRQAAVQNPEVMHFSVWNEPNLTGGNYLSPAQYRSLYRACYAELKSIRPAAKVYIGELETSKSGGVSSCAYFNTVANSTAQPIEADGLAIHPYQFTTPPTAQLTDDVCHGIGNLAAWSLALRGARSDGRLVVRGGGEPTLNISEFGYCSERPPARDGFPYDQFSGLASCGQQNAAGVANAQLTETQRRDWTQQAFALARSWDVALFDYHGVIQRDPWNFNGNERCPADGSNQHRRDDGSWVCHARDNPFVYWANPDSGYLWNSGIVRWVTGEFLPPVGALRTATGTVDPAASVSGASSVLDDGATFNGTVDTKGWRTTYHFEYGTTTAYGRSTPEVTLPGGTTNVPVSANVSGLPRGTTYHYKLVVANRTGRGESGVASFTSDEMSRPAVLTAPNGDMHVFFRGVDRQLTEWSWDGGWRRRVWGDTGVMAGDPSAVMLPGGRMEVFYRSTNGFLHRFWIDGGRSGLEQDDLVGRIRGDPAAVVGPTGVIEVFYRYVGDQLRQHEFDVANGTWFATTNEEPGAVIGDPAVIVSQIGRLEQFYRYRGDRLRRHWLAGGRFGVDVADDAGAMVAEPSAVEMPNGRVEVLYRYPGGKLRRQWFAATGGGATTNETFDAVLGDPVAVATRSGRLEVFYRYRGGNLRRHWFADPQWGVSDPATAGQVAGDPGAVATPDGTRHAFAGSRSGGYFHYAVTDTGSQLELIP